MTSAVKTTGVILLCGIVLAGCAKAPTNAKNSEVKQAVSEVTNKKAYGLYTAEDLAVATEKEATTTIELNNDKTTINGAGASYADQKVTITEAGTYIISGELKEGALNIAGDKTKDQINVVFNGVTLSSKTEAPVFVESAKKVVVSLAEGSENTITDNRSEAADTTADTATSVEVYDAAIYSKSDLTFNGTGELTVTGKMKDGIRSKDRLTMISGTYTIQAANNGLKGKDSVSILDGEYQIKAENDGIQADNTKDETLGWVAIDGGKLTVTAEHDGIQGETDVKVSQGTVNLTTGGGSAKAEKKQESAPGGMMVGGPNSDEATTGQEMTGGTPPDMPTGQPSNELAGAEKNDANQTNEKTATEETAQTAAEAAAEEVSASDSAKGLKAGKEMVVAGGTLTVNSKDDGIHSDGNVTIDGGALTIATGDDGIHANSHTTINGGNVTVTESYEGIEGAVITLTGGEVAVTASDDGVNASAGTDTTIAATLVVSGGTLNVVADGDGLDSNGDIEMTGGTVLVDGPTNGGNGALDYDGTFNQSGGTLVAAGSQGMAQGTSDSSEQAALAIYFDNSQKANTLVNVQDEKGQTIATYSPSKAFEWVLISSPELKQNATYQVSTGGTDKAEKIFGLSQDSQYTGGTSFKVELTDKITGVTDSGEAATVSQEGMPGGGGPGQGGPGSMTAPTSSTDATTGASATTETATSI